MVNVKKKSGALQEFNMEKLKASIMKAGAPLEVAEKVAKDVSAKITEGTSTTDIRNMVVDSIRSVSSAWTDAYTKYVKPSKGEAAPAVQASA